jgi:hypothetical protein
MTFVIMVVIVVALLTIAGVTDARNRRVLANMRDGLSVVREECDRRGRVADELQDDLVVAQQAAKEWKERAGASQISVDALSEELHKTRLERAEFKKRLDTIGIFHNKLGLTLQALYADLKLREDK